MSGHFLEDSPLLRLPLLMLLVFALTLFLSATLLFLVEPMVGKMILPLLGGTPAVWNTCMVFYQAVLLAGYAYAHASTTWLGPRKQAVFHLALLAVPFAFFPLHVNRDLLIGSQENPTLPLLLMLTIYVGVPLFVVCTTAPLLQKWFAATAHPAARDPYFLYGASNLGSMLALLGYPVVVEPLLRVQQQATWWIVGYATLALLALGCALLLWRWPPAPVLKEEPALASGTAHTSELGDTAVQDRPAPQLTPSPGRTSSRGSKRNRKHAHRVTAARPAPAAPSTKTAPAPDVAQTLGGTVTAWRRLRWVLLATVPSSLMLGATTYITTDIAAVPLLWVLPLGLYLLSFIIVFANIRLQNAFLAALVVGALAFAAYFCWNLPQRTDLELLQSRAAQFLLRSLAVLLLASCPFTWLFGRVRSTNVLHRGTILILPLAVLLLVFSMLADWKPSVAYNIALHLAVLFVVCLVCHGELARDRPDTRHLTEYFLWMSVGGVVGGLFNALIAPLAFNAIVEYPLALMGACLLLPPLTAPQGNAWGRRIDVALASLFAVFGVGLIILRVVDGDLQYHLLAQRPWVWQLVALLLALGLGVGAALRAGKDRIDAWLDLALPAGLLVLVVGLGWGLHSHALRGRILRIAQLTNNYPDSVRLALAVGLSVILCYTFVERSLRFGLGVGAILLGMAFCAGTNEHLLFQKRSFFGVLRVQNSSETFDDKEYPYRELIHGTTLHGEQFRHTSEAEPLASYRLPGVGLLPPAWPQVYDLALRQEPLTYYHRSGPIGQVFGLYNTDPGRPYGVIGLGTGTMACYALPGQHVTFYDIDPVVRDISFEPGGYFTYVEDARRRGAHLDLLLGDARVTMERQEAPAGYRLLVIDAFSSDAIPMHLITREALQVYRRHMAEDGIICFHVSNRYLDLKPVLANLAKKEGLAALYFSDDEKNYPGKARSSWVMLARSWDDLARLQDPYPFGLPQAQLETAAVVLCSWPDSGRGVAAQSFALFGMINALRSPWKSVQTDPTVGEWTDDYSNLLSVFSW
jgi:hypothetical protein